jgi:uncharacterized protein (TIGR02421 family)
MKATQLQALSKGLGLLEKLQWSKATQSEFFRHRGERMPEPEYLFDKTEAASAAADLQAFRKSLGTSAEDQLLDRTAASYASGFAMLAEAETKAFYALGLAQYGGGGSAALDGDTTNLDLAKFILERLGGDSAVPQQSETSALSATELRDALHARVQADYPELSVDFLFASSLSAKILAGLTRVRIREDAEFTEVDARSLYVHEIGTHLVTAQNGLGQTHLPFMASGGPRTTSTQEGLAVFAELYDKSLTTARLRRIARRVVLVSMAEAGADFMQVYRWLVEQGELPKDAYADASRIFRGGVLTGGAPFTKDACYLSGLVRVYNALRGAVRAADSAPVLDLLSGRVCLEDAPLLAELRCEGKLLAPRFLPSWAREWDTLAAYFAFTSFLNEIDFDIRKRTSA